MKKLYLESPILGILILAGCCVPEKKSPKFDLTGPGDPSLIRGFNYTPAIVAAARHHIVRSTFNFQSSFAIFLNIS
jgi:hypothetical protein